VLRVEGLVVRYGQATALDGVSLTVNEGEMVALIGPNGAGKTTLVNAISGLLRPAAGSVRVGGHIAQVPEGRQLFPELSVADNLSLGAWRSRRRRGARDPQRIYRGAAAAGEGFGAAGRNAVRWPAADGGRRSGADG